ncbi:Helix-turn-helix domain [Rubrobacter radiotolerans]|uniref:Helix-turn-helix domain n=1 Tax=Rubrobacter radiotolerans TaxID=42256 RepID=A0A023X4X4_RUBRA|nr:winged helix-turn-helix domain-containing protein [Rubrobacter radiotolerans]AHY47089.1 Helix-turn-helix domain [Rubrobacter radiotolerans]MDX5894494.1 winged helix-turn-helix domain-containing protein [Rubrobacter radiotolerans]
MTERRYSPDYEMEEFFEGTEPEHFKAFADGTRQRIASLLYERAATAKQLADALGQKPGSVAHHLKVLEGVGFVRVVRTRQVRAITEKYYGMTYRRITLSGRNFSWREELPGISPGFHFQQAVREYEALPAEERADASSVPVSVLRHARIPASVAREFGRRVAELAEEYDFEPVPGERVYGFVAGVYLTDQPELPEVEEEE